MVGEMDRNVRGDLLRPPAIFGEFPVTPGDFPASSGTSGTSLAFHHQTHPWPFITWPFITGTHPWPFITGATSLDFHHRSSGTSAEHSPTIHQLCHFSISWKRFQRLLSQFQDWDIFFSSNVSLRPIDLCVCPNFSLS